MSNLYLKMPTLEDKNEWLDFVNEYVIDNPKAKPLEFTSNISYEDWLKNRNDEYKGIDLKYGRVPSSSYFLMEDERIIGYISIRHNINTIFLSTCGGHIGYGIRPSERRKGYATKMLEMALTKCDELGLEKVMVSCKESNIGSAKTIENNGGILRDVFYIPEENSNIKKYWINVKEQLNRNNKTI